MNQLDFLETFQDQNILIAPLNWGLGHATRCVSIIHALSKNNNVILASDGLALEWLQQEFPKLDTIELPSYGISYNHHMMWVNMIRSSPSIIKAISREKEIVLQIVKEHYIDVIISDHRFGLYTADCRTIAIAHQINIPHSNPVLKGIASSTNKSYLNKYDQVWIPDYKNRRIALAGDISDSTGLLNYQYIGPLSRLRKVPTEKDIEILVLLSGPEPSRTDLENQILNLLTEKPIEKSVCIIRGSTYPIDKNDIPTNVEVIDFGNTEEVNNRMNRSKSIICRSGYSSIMDLSALELNALLIPTPNQPEQEYLAKLYKSRNKYNISKQANLNRNDLMNLFSS